MKTINTLLQYREPEYFLNRKTNELFVFKTLNPIMRVAKLIVVKNSHYFDYTNYQIKCITIPSIALSELNKLKIYHRECPQWTGIINGFYGLECTSDVGVVWNKGLGHLKLPSVYFWNDLHNLIIK